MNATGKKARKASGLDKAELHRAIHAKKSPEKRRKMGWTKSGTLKKA